MENKLSNGKNLSQAIKDIEETRKKSTDTLENIMKNLGYKDEEIDTLVWFFI